MTQEVCELDARDDARRLRPNLFGARGQEAGLRGRLLRGRDPADLLARRSGASILDLERRKEEHQSNVGIEISTEMIRYCNVLNISGYRTII